jgi:hypothetical protein
MTDLKHIRKLIAKWKINRAFLADKVGMPKTTFSYTLKGLKHYTFTPAQFRKLTKILLEMSDDFKTIG